MTRVAIIEHDPVLTTELRAAVESAGFQSDCFTESAAALPGVRTQAFALAILELGIRDADPFAICSEASGLIPVIAITSDRNEDLAGAVSAMRVHVEGETHPLSRGETEVLALLVASRGAPMTVLEMLARLPPKSQVKRGTIESRIKSLRRKLGPARLVSRGRLGYQLTED